MTAQHVLIGGGTGFVGRHLGLLLQRKKGHKVTIVSRMPAPNHLSWDQIESSGLPPGSNAVVNTAGQQLMDFTKSWSPGFKQNIVNSRVFTTKTLAKAVQKAPIKPEVFVLLTGVGAYEPSDKVVYDENSPPSNTDFYSNLVVKMEAAAKENLDPSIRFVSIRSGAVLGRGGGMIKNMYPAFFLGLGGPIGSGKQFLPWIHIDDLTRLIAFAIENTQVSGVLNGVAPQVITNTEFTKAFARALNRPAIFPVPEFVLNTLLNPERAMIMTKGQKVLPKKVLELGFKYDYPDIDGACKDLAK